MPVKGLVTLVVLREGFVYDDQKFPSQVVLDMDGPWRVVPCDLSFPIFALPRCLH